MDVHFERLLVVSGCFDSTIFRFHWIWVRVQKKEESASLAQFGVFPLKLCDNQRVAKLTLKNGRLKLVAKCFGTLQVVVLLVGAEGNQRGWRKVSFGVWL